MTRGKGTLHFSVLLLGAGVFVLDGGGVLNGAAFQTKFSENVCTLRKPHSHLSHFKIPASQLISYKLE